MPRATQRRRQAQAPQEGAGPAKGYYGRKHSSYRFANEQVMRSDAYAYRDRRVRKRDFRRLWITRINAAARQEGMSYSQLIHGLKRGRRRGEPQDARGHRRQRPRRLPPICRASPGGCRGLSRSANELSPGRSAQRPPFFVSGHGTRTDDHEPTQREAEAGPPPPAAPLARAARACSSARARTCSPPRARPGAEPVELLTAAGEGLGGTEVEPDAARRRLDARLGDPGDRRLAPGAGPTAPMAPCVYLHGVSDPGNVGTRDPHRGGPGRRLGRARSRTAPIRTGRGRCGRAWARSSPSRWCAAGRATRPSRGRRWSPTAASRSSGSPGAGDPLPRRRARGPAAGGPRGLRGRGDDSGARRRRVAQRRGGGGDRAAADRVAPGRERRSGDG